MSPMFWIGMGVAAMVLICWCSGEIAGWLEGNM